MREEYYLLKMHKSCAGLWLYCIKKACFFASYLLSYHLLPSKEGGATHGKMRILR